MKTRILEAGCLSVLFFSTFIAELHGGPVPPLTPFLAGRHSFLPVEIQNPATQFRRFTTHRLRHIEASYPDVGDQSALIALPLNNHEGTLKLEIRLNRGSSHISISPHELTYRVEKKFASTKNIEVTFNEVTFQTHVRIKHNDKTFTLKDFYFVDIEGLQRGDSFSYNDPVRPTSQLSYDVSKFLDREIFSIFITDRQGNAFALEYFFGKAATAVSIEQFLFGIVDSDLFHTMQQSCILYAKKHILAGNRNINRTTGLPRAEPRPADSLDLKYMAAIKLLQDATLHPAARIKNVNAFVEIMAGDNTVTHWRPFTAKEWPADPSTSQCGPIGFLKGSTGAPNLDGY